MTYATGTLKADRAIATDVNASGDFRLARYLRNDRRTRDDLYLGDSHDRDIYFNGEEGFDFVTESDPAWPTPAESAKLCPQQQQQHGKTPHELEEQYIQQQQQQCQM